MARKNRLKPAPPRGEIASRGFSWKLAAAVLVPLLTLLAYAPSFDGPFLLDDLYLPYGAPNPPDPATTLWRGNRPLLLLTFQANAFIFGFEPRSFHLANMFLHLATGGLIFLFLKRLLDIHGEAPPRAFWLSLGAAAVFLLHPINTEAVAYVASRSDILSTLLAFAALAVYVRRYGPGRPPPFWLALGALVLAGAAVLAKEQAAVLPAAFVLLDVILLGEGSPRGALKNWRFHLPVLAAGGVALSVVWRTLSLADTAGFRVAGLAWWQYLLAQGRAIWRYVRLVILPVGQNLDPDFPVARSWRDPWGLAGWALLLALAVAAWRFRRRWRMASFGFLLFLLMLAPTSSFVPILDPVAERRVYFAFPGLLLVGLEACRRLRPSRQQALVASAAVVAVLALLTHSRAKLWGDDLALWSETAARSPNKVRPQFQVAHALYTRGRCPESAAAYSRAAALAPPEARLLVNWALALDCAGQPEQALTRLGEAAALEQSASTQATIGMIHAKQGRSAEALAALDLAEKLDPQFAMTYVYRGNVAAMAGDWDSAITNYRRALEFDPANEAARRSLDRAIGQSGRPR